MDYQPMIYQEGNLKSVQTISEISVFLYLDGKSSIHNDSIMCFSDNVSWLHYIYQTNVIDTSCQPYTAENLQEITMSSIRNLQEDFSAVTDIGP